MQRLIRAAAVIAACAAAPAARAGDAYLAPPGIAPDRFPPAIRPVAPIVSDRWRDEDSRQRVGEAARVVGWLGIKPGMAVADIGAGSGYYTVHLAADVAPGGVVLAQDVMPDYVAALRARVAAAGLTDVRVAQGDPGDPRLPPASTDVALMVHMYHEIQLPFALLGNLIPSLRPGGRLGIVDVDDITERHGTPRALLECELSAAGFHQVAFHWLLVAPPRSEYLAVYEPPAAPPFPESVVPCRG